MKTGAIKSDLRFTLKAGEKTVVCSHCASNSSSLSAVLVNLDGRCFAPDTCTDPACSRPLKPTLLLCHACVLKVIDTLDPVTPADPPAEVHTVRTGTGRLSRLESSRTRRRRGVR